MPVSKALAASSLGRAWREADLWAVRVPVVLLAAQLLGLLVHVAVNVDAYGRGWDEGYQDLYGVSVLRFYSTFGANRDFIDAFAPSLHQYYYGPLWELTIAAVQELTGNQWPTRAVMGGLVGVLGVGGMALVGRQLAGWWGALLAATGLALYPRYLGAMVNNSKDVPLTVAMIFVLWATIRLVRRWEDGAARRRVTDAAVLGLLLGAAVGVRSVALIWVGVLGLLIVGRWVAHGRRLRLAHGARKELVDQVRAAVVTCVVAYALVLATFPYVMLHPLTGLWDSAAEMSSYRWPGATFFEGQLYGFGKVPWTYPLRWLVIGSPPLTIAFALAGLALIAADLLRRRRVDPALLLTAALLLVPVTLLVVRHGVTLYNGLRQFMFVVPGMVALGAVAVTRLFAAALSRRPAAAALGRRPAAAFAAMAVLVVGVLAGHVEALVTTVRLFPFEYAYFSPVVGGFAGADRNYEGDYWRTCETVSVDWLARARAAAGFDEELTVAGAYAVMAYNERFPVPPGIVILAADEGAPVPVDTAITAGDQRPDALVISPKFEREYWMPPVAPDYELAHEVLVDGIPICKVYLTPAIADRLG